MDCAVENAMIKHQEKLMKQETSLQLFIDSIDDDLVEIQELINKVKKKADGFDEYDFTEEVKQMLGDLI